MKYFSIIILSLLGYYSSAQTDKILPLSFEISFDNQSLIILENDTSSQDIQIEVFKFYISKLELFEGEEMVFEEEGSYHLLDANDETSLSLDLNIPDSLSFTHIRFDIGIDSTTNVSGAFGGDLDPTNGMYWTWQSGYINFKLEGITENCPARHHRFQFHIGGYQLPYRPVQEVKLEVLNNTAININLSLDKIFQSVNIEENYEIMSPNENSLEFSTIFPSLFSISE